MDHNGMALHTLPGCMHSTPPNQMGVSGELDCSKPVGCVVAETKPNSYREGFATAGGGVFAAQFDVAGCVSHSSMYLTVLIIIDQQNIVSLCIIHICNLVPTIILVSGSGA